MSAGSKFHSCDEETEKPLRPDRSFRYRGTRSWTWDDDWRLHLAGMSFTEWQSSIKYSSARPARQLLVMELSLFWIWNWIGSQWRSRRIAAEIGSYLPILRIKHAAEFRTVFLHKNCNGKVKVFFHPLPQTFGISYHVIFHPFLLFLLSGRDSSVLFFRVPSLVFPLHPLTLRFVMSPRARVSCRVNVVLLTY